MIDVSFAECPVGAVRPTVCFPCVHCVGWRSCVPSLPPPPFPLSSLPLRHRNNPYTGTFHHEPGKYSSLHGKRALDSLYSPVATPSLPTLALPPLDLGPALADVAAVAGSARACKDDDARSDTGSVSSVSVPASPAATPLSDPLTFRTCDVTLALAIQSTMASTATFTTFGRGRIQVTTFVAPL